MCEVNDIYKYSEENRIQYITMLNISSRQMSANGPGSWKGLLFSCQLDCSGQLTHWQYFLPARDFKSVIKKKWPFKHSKNTWFSFKDGLLTLETYLYITSCQIIDFADLAFSMTIAALYYTQSCLSL